jgi:hypothetical protein
MLWIFDYIPYRIEKDSFPLEIALLNVNTQQCHVFYIKYPNNYFNNFRAKIQHENHELQWKEDDETLYSAMFTVQKLVSCNNAQIIVNNWEKHDFLQRWFKNVLVFGSLTPPHIHYHNATPCSRHANNDEFCAKRQCIRLMLCYNDRIMYVNNPMSLMLENFNKLKL